MSEPPVDAAELVTEERLAAEWRRYFIETDAVGKAFAVRGDAQRAALLRTAVKEVSDPAHLEVVRRIAADIYERGWEGGQRECAAELRALITPQTRTRAFLRHLARNYSFPLVYLYRLADRWSGDSS